MKKRQAGLVIITMLLLFCGVASAGVINLLQTGQTKCYNSTGTQIDCACTGQDGEFQAGAAVAEPRFTDNGNGTLTDTLTGLMWLKDANCIYSQYSSFDVDYHVDGAVTLRHAFDFVAGINSGTYANCGAGFFDWRLPNRSELASLATYSQYSISYLLGEGFTNIYDFTYKSSTFYTMAGQTKNSWIVDPEGDFALRCSKDDGNFCNDFVWPVRAGQNGAPDPSFPANVPRTGQTSCWDTLYNSIPCTGTREDGDIQAGVAWPNPRFTNPDGTVPISGSVVVDQLTGLMWTADALTPGPAACSPGTVKNWQGNLDHVACLNQNNYLGYSDWRLPNVVEFESLYNAEQGNNVTWLQGQGFTNIQNAYYWTSTTLVETSNTNYAWMVHLTGGTTLNKKEGGTDKSAVWPVRGGQAKPQNCTPSNNADLAVTNTDVPDPVAAGGTMTYTITVTNNGPDAATGVTLTDALPAGVTYGSYTSTQGTCVQAAGVITCSVGGMANAAVVTIILTVTAPGTGGTITNTAVVSSTTNDPNSANNTANASTTVIGPTQYGLTINKSGAGTGTVAGTNGLNCTTYPCFKTYDAGTAVTITANSGGGSTFGGWSGGTGSASSCSGTGPCTFTINAESSVTATFAISVVPPTVSTSAVSEIASTTAVGGGDVTSDGGATVTDRGVCWGTLPNPTNADTHHSYGPGTGPFTCSISGLIPNTTYHVRAYATNSAGTTYGNDVAFTTLNGISPTVSIPVMTEWGMVALNLFLGVSVIYLLRKRREV